jgi:hypothetical protein
MGYSRSVGQPGPFEPSLDAHMRPRARTCVRTAITVSLWKRNRVGEEISAVEDGDDAVVGGGAVVDHDVSGVTGNSVERYAGLGIDYRVFKVRRAQEVGCGRSDVHECEVRVHREKGRGLESEEERSKA